MMNTMFFALDFTKRTERKNNINQKFGNVEAFSETANPPANKVARWVKSEKPCRQSQSPRTGKGSSMEV